MQNKLKTLKEIPMSKDPERNTLSRDMLREEVIKWAKSPCPHGCKVCGTVFARNEFIKEFFNLTEEDLKDAE